MRLVLIVFCIVGLLIPVPHLSAGCPTGDKVDRSSSEGERISGSACEPSETATAEPAKTTAPDASVAADSEKKDEGRDLEQPVFPTVTGNELAQWIADKEPVIILDARSGKWDDGKRIPGAKQLTDTATPEEVSRLLVDKSAKIVTYCSNLQCPASLRLAKYLRELGYTNVIKYPGGLEDWLKAGREVVTVKQ